jgi:hypothetical protein
MRQQSVRLKTVTAKPFKDHDEIVIPRLHLDVQYTKGGTSVVTGKVFARGYEVGVYYDHVYRDGQASSVVSNATENIAVASRFTPARFESILADIAAGTHNELITKLYARAVSAHPEHAWPESIFPISNTAAE